MAADRISPAWLAREATARKSARASRYLPAEYRFLPAALPRRISSARGELAMDVDEVAGFSVEPASDSAVSVNPMTAPRFPNCFNTRGCPVGPGDSAQ